MACILSDWKLKFIPLRITNARFTFVSFHPFALPLLQHVLCHTITYWSMYLSVLPDSEFFEGRDHISFVCFFPFFSLPGTQ